MENLKIPMGYHADLNLHDTQVAIKTVKIGRASCRERVSSPV